MKKTQAFKHLNLALHAAWWLVMLLLAFLLVTVIGAKINGRVPKLFGYSVMHIISDSMEPTIHEDSYILIKETDVRTIKERDIICFYSPDPLIYGLPNTHRVISPPIVTENGILFQTQGDKSPAPDADLVAAERVVGVYVRDMPLLSAFSKALNGGLSFVLVLIVQISIITVSVVTVVMAKKNKEETEEN